MEVKTAKVIFNQSGGTAGKGGVTNRVTLPTTWIKAIGVTKENRDVEISFDGEKIIIKSSEKRTSKEEKKMKKEVVKTIYNFSEIEVLKADGCNEKEAEKHLKNGATIYTPEDYFSMLQGFPKIAEEHGIEKIEQIIQKCKAVERSGDTLFTEYSGVPCVIEYVL